MLTVFLVWQNDAVLDVYATYKGARTRVEKVMQASPDPDCWTCIVPRLRWTDSVVFDREGRQRCAGRTARLEIEETHGAR